MNKIIVRVFGGLGNQLFCFAAGRRMALVNHAELVIDDFTGFAYDVDYQRHYQLDHFNISCRKASAAERLEPFSRARRYLKRCWNMRKPFVHRSYITREFIDFDSRILQIRPRGEIILDGCWQSESYFKDVASTIRSDLVIKPPIDQINLTISHFIRSTLSVAIHLRFFGSQNQDKSYDVDRNYYIYAIRQLENRFDESAHYFIFSNCPEDVIAYIPLPLERVTIVKNNHGDENAYADLWLMAQCQHFIIANSTFSWWAAWLAEREGKEQIVYTPNIQSLSGRSGWGFVGLIPNRWLVI